MEKEMKINARVYPLRSTKGSYAYVILGNEIILVDTGQVWEGRAIIKELLSKNIHLEDIKHTVLNHHDLDHIGNAAKLQQLTNANLYASAEDIPYIMGYPNMNWDEIKLRESIESIGKLPFKWVCPAHGEPVKRDKL